MRHRFFQVLPKNMRWVYRQLHRVKIDYGISVYITYKGKYTARYNYFNLLMNEAFMIDLYKNMSITKLVVEKNH